MEASAGRIRLGASLLTRSGTMKRFLATSLFATVAYATTLLACQPVAGAETAGGVVTTTEPSAVLSPATAALADGDDIRARFILQSANNGLSAATGATAAPDIAAVGAAPGSGARCSLATLNGTYIMQAQGVALGGPAPGPFGYASISTYDGKGGTHATYSGSFDGVILRNQLLTGTYTVNEDCTGTETADLAGGVVAHYDNFLSPAGNMYTSVQTDSGVVVTEIFYRVPQRSNDS
jgi:hypothetical protein